MKPAHVLPFFVACMALPAFAQSPASVTPHISVTGEATVYVQPDKILITLGVETWDMEVVVAKNENNEILARTVDAIKSLGLTDKDYQTDHLSIEPRWREVHDRQPREFLGYFVRNTMVVTLTDVNKIEALITDVLKAGVNHLHGIDFQSTEFKKHREEARELALKAAREKAEKMAAVLDEEIGAVLEIQEHGGNPWYASNWNSWGSSRAGGGYAMNQNAIVVQEGPASNSETVALGKIGITISVSIVFELKR
jgi:uncharacterized protein YggE